jgi:predicted nucleic acid-binding protein
MVVYMDTSAIVKRYFEEHRSEDVIALWRSASHLIASSVAYAETMACIWRKVGESDLDSKTSQMLVTTFRHDWTSFVRIEVNDELNGYIDEVAAAHPLRGFDAIHLASALLIHGSLPEPFVFACFDKALSSAAKASGLTVFPTPAS